jgi:hypothetical protein
MDTSTGARTVARTGAEITYPPPPALHAPERLEVLQVPGGTLLD